MYRIDVAAIVEQTIGANVVRRRARLSAAALNAFRGG